MNGMSRISGECAATWREIPQQRASATILCRNHIMTIGSVMLQRVAGNSIQLISSKYDHLFNTGIFVKLQALSFSVGEINRISVRKDQ